MVLGAGLGFVYGESSLKAVAKLSKLYAQRDAKLNGEEFLVEDT